MSKGVSEDEASQKLRQTLEGCEFCEGNDIMLTDYGDYEVSLDGRIKIKGDLDGTDYLDINYCPVCGKRL